MPPEGFSREQVERARRYHRPLYGAFAVETLIGFALLAALAFTGLGDLLYRPLEPWPWWARVLALGFVGPVLLEPLFDRFAPLRDGELADDLRALAARAGVPVRDVLVAEASRRTRKENAYVSGLGRTRRVVLFDTLLRGNEPRAVRLVVAHELGHRRDRHVVKATVLAMAAAAAGVLVVWASVSDPGDPRSAPL